MPAKPDDVSAEQVDRRTVPLHLDEGARHYVAGRRAASGGHAAGDDFVGSGRGDLASEELKLPAKQLLVLRYLAAAQTGAADGGHGNSELHDGADHGVSRKGLLQADIAHPARGLRQATRRNAKRIMRSTKISSGP